MLEEGLSSPLVRGQVGMVDGTELCSPIHSTFEASIVPRAVGHCYGEELGPSCWPVLAVGVTVFSASHRFAEHISQMWWFCGDSESCSGSNWQQTTEQWPWSSFGACLALKSALELLLGLTPELVVVWSPLFIACHNPVEKLLHRIWEDNILKLWFFLFVVSSWCTHLSRFFIFSIFFKCQMTVEWLILSSLASSLVVVRGSVSMILSVGCCQLLMASPCASYLQASHCGCKTSWNTIALYIC